MAIPESQLETWSHQGAVAQSRDTYATVKRCLEASTTRYAEKSYSIFLQGSYGNDTNIFTESDVDIVIRLESTYSYDIDALAPVAKDAFHSHAAAPTYTYSDFKDDVVATLKSCYGTAVSIGSKAISIAPYGNRRKADVIVALEHRRYRSYSAYQTNDYVAGIAFYTAAWERVVNFPRQHSANMTAKHQRTSSWFKPTVRILKNMRRRMVRDGVISPGLAPSYYLEGLLYNVPDSKFGTTYEDTVVDALNWLIDADRASLVCANNMYWLFGGVPHVCWSMQDFESFLRALVPFWKTWK